MYILNYTHVSYINTIQVEHLVQLIFPLNDNYVKI